VRRRICAQAGSGTDDKPPVTPPWERPDEFEPVRQRIRQYGLRSSEEKILVQLRKFKATEEMYLKWFAEAEREGDDDAMRKHLASWETVSEKMELMLANPRKFAWKYGDIYDVESKRDKQARKSMEPVLELCRLLSVPASFFLFVWLVLVLLSALG
jgi:hypothetical protein